MVNIERRRAAAIVVSAGIVGIVCGSGAIALASNSAGAGSPPAAEPTPSHLVPVDYPTNAVGDTLGEHKLGTVPPTLIEAIADNGRSGYIYRRDLEGSGRTPSSPEEAVRMTRDRFNAKGQLILPVYAADGRTQIGTFLAATVVTGDPGDRTP